MEFTSTFKSKLIYVFRINDKAHKDCLKIGETTFEIEKKSLLTPNSKALNDAANKRIRQYTQTAGIQYELLYTEQSVYNAKDYLQIISDSEVHRVLLRSGIPKRIFDKKNKANEWFETDLQTVKNAIKAVKEGRKTIGKYEISTEKSPVVFRPEQLEAIEKTKKQFRIGNKMLWFAKMRFGKTLTALQVVKDMNFARTLILTHRPVVDTGWFEDFGKIFYDKSNFEYGSKKNGESIHNLEKQQKSKKLNYIYFASIQDLRGSSQVGGNFNKNHEIFGNKWDFIIVDEAHEGIQTELGNNVLNILRNSTTKFLHLSGTPFNLLDNYLEDQIYTWDYVMEQKAKCEWDKTHFGDPNPYSSLPRLNIYTYDLGSLLKSFIDEDVAFNFRELFKVKDDGTFLYKNDILSFLNLLCKEDKNSNYPFSNKAYRANFRHSLWMVPGVREARALSSLLQTHPVFGQFKIVNVAGDGDEEETNEEALKKVKKAISNKPQETYSITLSCGRLTTGVSIPAWTAVFMLAGSSKTSASSYMQTIFRVQTPASINGKVKEECFVFDFAPDRTLKVIAETTKLSTKAGRNSSGERETLRDFLNFCPVIAVEGSNMTNYNVSGLLEQLKKVYVERVVRNGFEDRYLYNNDELMSLNNIDLKAFDRLKKIIGNTKAIHRSEEIDINKQGFTNEEYDQLDVIEKKNKMKNQLTEEEIRILNEKEEKRKIRDTAVSILRGISIRMPLLIYGAELKDEETQININNFSKLIDDKSWNEFMPAGVTKAVFEKFKKYYEPDVFRAAGIRIRAMARAADQFSVEDRISRITDIFSTFRNPDKETVLTPWRVVNMHMSDCLGGFVFYDDNMEHKIDRPRFVNHGTVTNNVFDKDSKILEINSKSGLYPLYMGYTIYKRLLDSKFSKKNRLPTIEEQQILWDKVVNDNLFVLCKTPMAESITKRTLVGFRKVKVNTRYFSDLVNQISKNQKSFLAKIKQGNTFWKSNNNDDMKFNAIVGNPPYQEMDGGTDRGAIPIYQKFVNIGKGLSPDYLSMIMPARWYAGGRGLDEFRTSMLSDKNIAVLVDYETSKNLFPTVDIAGGLCYFLWSKTHNDLCKVVNVGHETNDYTIRALDDYPVFIRSNRAISIISKIVNITNAFMNNNVLPINPFGYRTYYRGRDNKLKNDIKILSSKGWGYVSRRDVNKNKDLIDKYKVIIGRFVPSNGELNLKPDDKFRVITNPQLILPEEIHTETYICVAVYNTKEEAENFIKYLHSKFARFLLRQSITSVNVTKECFSFVPVLNFNDNSNIDWSKSIPEIDKQLYSAYSLTKVEIDFIESIIKSIE